MRRRIRLSSGVIHQRERGIGRIEDGPRAGCRLLSQVDDQPDVLLQQRPRQAGQPVQSSFVANDIERKELEQFYLMSFNRNLKLLVVLSGGLLEGRHSYREQIFEALPNVPFEGKAVVEYFRDADHTFTSESARTRLQELVLGLVRALSSSPHPPKPGGD